MVASSSSQSPLRDAVQQQAQPLPGVHTSPNIQAHPELYEVENQALDPGGYLLSAMRSIASWRDKVVLDVGAGTGFYLPVFQREARHVIAVEPHAPSRLRAMDRVAGLRLQNVSVMDGSAEQLLLPDASVDIVHARFAYFFGPGCERGLQELQRVVKPGGTAFIIDNDYHNGDFARWIKRVRSSRKVDPDLVRRFWRRQGFEQRQIMSEWRFQRRQDFEDVIGIEFPTEVAAAIIREHSGLSCSYAYCLYHKTYGVPRLEL